MGTSYTGKGAQWDRLSNQLSSAKAPPHSGLSVLAHAHYDHPIQRSYGPEPVEDLLRAAHEMATAVSNEGASMRVEPDEPVVPMEVGNPHNKWYAVGGAKDPRTKEAVPETAVSHGDDSVQMAAATILRTDNNNRIRDKYTQASVVPEGLDKDDLEKSAAGGWSRAAKEGEEGLVGAAPGTLDPDTKKRPHVAVYDESSIFRDKRTAVKKTIERDEDEYFEGHTGRSIDPRKE